ncbi:MAG TPA: cobyrinate a,c-diamide synthase [Candidatus Nanopelagicales bacterium]|nr:cobyrinate a,c-diamide synthase [Candidatus Nanopelagicales bacterium]
MVITSSAGSGRTVPGRHRLARLVVAAPASGHGKTTVATGLLAALRAEGLEPAGFKIGPDYIDPGYHALATGRPGRNLDPFLCGEDRMVPLLLHGSQVPTPADVAVVEGVMGLFDGRMGGDGWASTAHVARVIRAPIVLVLDISSVSRTAAAVVHGLHTFEPDTRIAGVILNKAGSARHRDEVVEALEATGIEVLGALPRDAGIEAPSRHLGLVPAAERPEAAATLARLASQIADHVDLTRVLAIAHAAPDLVGEPWSPAAALATLAELPDPTAREAEARVVAVAGGRAFTFRYAETTELLVAAGLRPVIFDPLTDPALPDGTAGIYLGGGFPEVHAVELAGNASMIDSVRAAIAAGVPTVAECAGLLYLCRSVDGVPLVGALAADAAMTPQLTLGYRAAVADHDHLLGPAGRRVTGHEFHRTITTPVAGSSAAWLVDGVPVGFSADPASIGNPTVHASYLHLHWAGHPSVAARFAAAVHAAELLERKPRPTWIAVQNADLEHHGDRDVADGLVDLAVNVRVPAPPSWLAEAIRASVDDLAAYPDPSRARAAIAAAHDVGVDQVLPSAGGAELFTLLARARSWSAPVVVHPQFTEPEAALRAAGRPPRRVVLTASRGFRLDPGLVPADADLVIIGNPTNPTGVLHQAEVLRSLSRPGRVLVLDEAFMDAVPGEPESLITGELAGVVVLRSLTKTWGLAGLRAGYAVGDPSMITAMAAQQPPWSVSTLAAEAMIACMSPQARAHAAEAAAEITRRREHLVSGLTTLGLAVVPGSRAPFVLVDSTGWQSGDHPAGALRLRLRERGFAVRRGETFPGLGADWIRIAVRDQETTDTVIKTLRALREES